MLDELFESESTARAIAEHGVTDYPLNFAKSPITPDSLNERLFGTKAPIRATATVEEEPLFDYAEELARTKANISPELEQLQNCPQPLFNRSLRLNLLEPQRGVI